MQERKIHTIWNVLKLSPPTLLPLNQHIYSQNSKEPQLQPGAWGMDGQKMHFIDFFRCYIYLQEIL